MKSTFKRCKLAIAIALGFAAGLPATQISAETCLSPYIKGLKQPEKVMYLWRCPPLRARARIFWR